MQIQVIKSLIYFIILKLNPINRYHKEIKDKLLLLSHFSCFQLCATPQTKPIRLPHPWDSPGKNTGVGCHFLLQCMKVKSQSEVTQSCPTFRDPMDCSLPGSSVHGIFQASVLEWGAIAFSKRQATYVEKMSVAYISNQRLVVKKKTLNKGQRI